MSMMFAFERNTLKKKKEKKRLFSVQENKKITGLIWGNSDLLKRKLNLNNNSDNLFW